MDSSGRLYSQVAAMAGVSPDKAMVAVYLADLSRHGKTMDQAASLLRKERYFVRDVARDWGIQFPDYAPSQPKVLTWRKAKVGWDLFDAAGERIAECRSSVAGGIRSYSASLLMDACPVAEEGSTAPIAMRRLSEAVDHSSMDLFGVDDVAVLIERDGTRECLAPVLAADPYRLKQALAA